MIRRPPRSTLFPDPPLFRSPPSARPPVRSRSTTCSASSDLPPAAAQALNRGMPLPPFQAALDEHRDAVARFLVATVGRQDADDCLQETLLAALRAYPRLRPGSNVRAWLLTIARNKATDSHRARRRQPVPVGAELEEPADRAAPAA